MGGLYGVTLVAETLDSRRNLFTKSLEKGGRPQLEEVESHQEILLLNLIFDIAPVLNDACKLDCLTRTSGNRQLYGGSSTFKSVMGLCYNNEVYFQLAKGLLNPEVLEILCN